MNIINATWGYHGHFIDVTDILLRAIDVDGDLTIAVTTKTLSDPCKGWIKELNVIYSHQTNNYHIMVQEQHPQTNGGRVLYIKSGIPSTNTKFSGLMTIKVLV